MNKLIDRADTTPDIATDIAVQLSGLGKIYHIYEKPLDRLYELFSHKPRHTTFVALENVDLTLYKGQTLGIMGDNGAGKSTLLQLIAGTVTPSSGSVSINGSVLGLLELGVGFHGSFSGRENIFFYADTLGVSRQYILSRFDEIVAFSELGEFIDRPLHTYSTGMQMRLAFSLIASLDPDLLIIDEALSVGDMHFQKKCINRIMDFKHRGKTIIFCSHSSYQVGMFCEQLLWLKNGRVEQFGETAKVLPLYEAYQLRKDQDQSLPVISANDLAVIREFDLLSPLPINCGDNLVFHIQIEARSPALNYHVSLSIKLENGLGLFVTGTHLKGESSLSGTHRSIHITFPSVPLMGGVYTAHARLFDDQGFVVFHEMVMPPFEVRKSSKELGFCRLANYWEIN